MPSASDNTAEAGPAAAYAASYERPVSARLFVRLDNGDEWEATPADLERFRLVDPRTVYRRFEQWVVQALGLERDKHIVRSVANPLRYAVECALFYDHMPDDDTASDLRESQRRWDAAQAAIEQASHG